MAATTFDLGDVKRRMQGAVNASKHDLGSLRTGRASPNLLDPIQVESYGALMPINQVATVSVPEPRLLSVSVWDRSLVHAVEKAIRDSDLGVNPANDGKVLRCVFPELTEERRKEFIKVARAKAEDGRVAVRNLRRTAKHGLEKLEKDGEVGKDDVTGAEKRLDGMTKKHVDAIDDMLKHKEGELLEV